MADPLEEEALLPEPGEFPPDPGEAVAELAGVGMDPSGFSLGVGRDRGEVIGRQCLPAGRAGRALADRGERLGVGEHAFGLPFGGLEPRLERPAEPLVESGLLGRFGLGGQRGLESRLLRFDPCSLGCHLGEHGTGVAGCKL